jgi:type IV pilus assembly protein PilW
MSLVELMVGVTIGLFIVAAATLLVGNQLTDNRRLLLETQLQQDMRASMDIMTRQIRRAGLEEANTSLSLLLTTTGQPGRFTAAERAVDLNAARDEITFKFYLNPADQGPWGFKLDNGRIKTRLSSSGWQDLTDGATVKVTALQFTPVINASEAVPCPRLCPDGTMNCWPRSTVRSYVVTLEAESASDPLVKRRMQSVARVRNNLPVFNANSETQPCP